MGLKSYIKRAALFIIKGIPEYKTTIEVKLSSPSAALKGRNILITGGNRGLGYCFAKKCVSEGANVIITGRDEIKLKKAAIELDCKFLVLDSSDFASMDSIFLDAEKMLDGKIDSLISNAGISLHEGNFRNVTVDGWDAQMDTNLKGNFFIVQKFIQYLESKEDKKGNIVVITSERAKRSDDIINGCHKPKGKYIVAGDGCKWEVDMMIKLLTIIYKYTCAMEPFWVGASFSITLLAAVAMRKRHNLKRVIAVCFTILYLCLVYTSTVLSRSAGEEMKFKLTPFWSYAQWRQGNEIFLQYIILNLLLLLPVGVSLSCIWGDKKKVLLAGFGFSCFVEISQLLSRRGLMETDDVIHNTMGVFLGILLHFTAVKIWKKNEKIRHVSQLNHQNNGKII